MEYVDIKQDFSWAFQQLRAGEAVKRESWNIGNYLATAAIATSDSEEGEIIYGDPVLALKDENNNWTPEWTPDNEDLFAEDWVIVPNTFEDFEEDYDEYEEILDRSGYKLEY